jgi:hypothetical protein
LPNLDEVNKKGHANGIFPLIWDGKEMFIYPLMPDYRDGWAIAEAGASEPLLAVTSTATTNPNAFQANWLNAEVDATGVTIYQYQPGYCLRVWRLSKDMDMGLRGDANLDNDVTIADVTTLIDLLLSGREAPREADCDLNGDVSISDVTSLIDYLLRGSWPAK